MKEILLLCLEFFLGEKNNNRKSVGNFIKENQDLIFFSKSRGKVFLTRLDCGEARKGSPDWARTEARRHDRFAEKYGARWTARGGARAEEGAARLG